MSLSSTWCYRIWICESSFASLSFLILCLQAKKFVESVPVIIKNDLMKEEAEELMKAIEKVGGKTIME